MAAVTIIWTPKFQGTQKIIRKLKLMWEGGVGRSACVCVLLAPSSYAPTHGAAFVQRSSTEPAPKTPAMDFGTVNFDDLFDFSPEPLDSREAEVQRQNETSFLSSGFPGSAGGRTSMVGGGGDGDAFQQRVKQGDGGGWAGGGGGGEGQQYSQSIGIPQVDRISSDVKNATCACTHQSIAALPSTPSLSFRHRSC